MALNDSKHQSNAMKSYKIATMEAFELSEINEI